MVTALFGLIDFSDDNIPLEKIRALYESDFPYLQITEAGKAEIYGIVPAAKSDLDGEIRIDAINHVSAESIIPRPRKSKRVL